MDAPEDTQASLATEEKNGEETKSLEELPTNETEVVDTEQIPNKQLNLEKETEKVDANDTKTAGNPCSDPRKMRRIIAEDPEWTLATVPLLSDLSIKHICDKFATNPMLDELPIKEREKVLKRISPELPINITAELIDNEKYWERCCAVKWKICSPEEYDGSYKRLFFERLLESKIENFVPGISGLDEMLYIIALSHKFIKRLKISQLLPPIRESPKDDGFSDIASIMSDITEIDHFDFNDIVDKLPFLEELDVTYQVRNCGMNFEWNLFLLTSRDCLAFSKTVQGCKTLTKISLHHSKLDCEKSRILISHLLDHPTLVDLDLSHNKVADSGARAVGKLLNNRSEIKRLSLLDNRIRSHGAGSLAYALVRNTKLTWLDLRLNHIADEGCRNICKSLVRNRTLVHLDISANDITEPTADYISEAIKENKTLEVLKLSCNKLGLDGGKKLQEAMAHNTTIVDMDLRLTEAGEESEFTIQTILHNNQNTKNSRHIEQLLESASQYNPPRSEWSSPISA